MSEITPNTPNPVREDAYKQQLAEKLGIDPKYIPGSPIWHSEEEIAAIAEMFANMSGGGSSGGGVLVVNIDDDTGALNKTWQEIRDAMAAGQIVSIPSVNSEVEVYSAIIGTAWLTSDDKYGLWPLGANAGTNDPFAIAQTANDYPVIAG